MGDGADEAFDRAVDEWFDGAYDEDFMFGKRYYAEAPKQNLSDVARSETMDIYPKNISVMQKYIKNEWKWKYEHGECYFNKLENTPSKDVACRNRCPVHKDGVCYNTHLCYEAKHYPYNWNQL